MVPKIENRTICNVAAQQLESVRTWLVRCGILYCTLLVYVNALWCGKGPILDVLIRWSEVLHVPAGAVTCARGGACKATPHPAAIHQSIDCPDLLFLFWFHP
jgi:hypothetical protein